MKKMCFLVTCILILQMLCSCSTKKEEFQNPVNFYYCNKEISYNSASGVIQPEIREGKSFYNNLTAFLHAYLLGPQSTELQSMIPSGVYLVSCDMNADVVSIELSTQFSSLSGAKLTTVCSAILMTVHDYTGAQTLIIRVKDAQIDDKDEYVLSIDDIVLIDTVAAAD